MEGLPSKIKELKEIFNQIQRFAEQIELPAEFIKTLWEQILRMSRDLQNKEMSDG